MLWCCYALFLQEDLGLPESTYELCYNAACTLIGQGQLTEAINKLRQAEGKRALTVLCFKRSVDGLFPSWNWWGNDSARHRNIHHISKLLLQFIICGHSEGFIESRLYVIDCEGLFYVVVGIEASLDFLNPHFIWSICSLLHINVFRMWKGLRIVLESVKRIIGLVPLWVAIECAVTSLTDLCRGSLAEDSVSFSCLSLYFTCMQYITNTDLSQMTTSNLCIPSMGSCIF